MRKTASGSRVMPAPSRSMAPANRAQRSDTYTRTRLLNRLGLFHQNQGNPLSIKPSTPAPPRSYKRSVLGGVVPFKGKLKNEQNKPSPTPHRSSVKFNEIVSMVNIPSRYQYSDRVKKFIWSDRWELQEMAERNLIEFEAEGYDWRNVVLDDDMYIDSINGQLIHPCHYHSFDNDEDSKYDEDRSFLPLTKLDSFVGLSNKGNSVGF